MSQRNRELVNLLVVGVLTGIGFASVYIARQAEVSTASLSYALFFLALYLAAHVAARYAVPHADPYLLPIAALLTAIGLTMIYRLNPTDAFRQGLWIVIGVAVFAATLLAAPRRLPRDRALQVPARGRRGRAPVPARAARLRPDHQRRAPLGPRRAARVPAGRAGEDHADRLPRRLPAREARGARGGRAKDDRAAARRLGRRDARPRRLERPRLGAPLLRDLPRDALRGDGAAHVRRWRARRSSSSARPAPTRWSATCASASRSGSTRGRRSTRPATSSSSPRSRSATATSAAPGSARAPSRRRAGHQLIPYLNTDFIYSALAQELGLVGCAAVVLLYMLFCLRGFRAALLAEDGFSKLLARRAHVRLRAADVHHRRRDPARDPADGDHASVHLLRRLEHRRELHPARAAPARLQPRPGAEVNRRITRVAVAAVVMLGALIVGTTYWQTWASAGLADRQDNEIQRVAAVHDQARHDLRQRRDDGAREEPRRQGRRQDALLPRLPAARARPRTSSATRRSSARRPGSSARSTTTSPARTGT